MLERDKISDRCSTYLPNSSFQAYMSCLNQRPHKKASARDISKNEDKPCEEDQITRPAPIDEKTFEMGRQEFIGLSNILRSPQQRIRLKANTTQIQLQSVGVIFTSVCLLAFWRKIPILQQRGTGIRVMVSFLTGAVGLRICIYLYMRQIKRTFWSDYDVIREQFRSFVESGDLSQLNDKIRIID